MAKITNMTEEVFEQLLKRESIYTNARKHSKSITVLTMHLFENSEWKGYRGIYEKTARKTKKQVKNTINYNNPDYYNDNVLKGKTTKRVEQIQFDRITKTVVQRRTPNDRNWQAKMDSRKRHEYLNLQKAETAQETLEQNKSQTRQYQALARMNGLEKVR